MPHVWKGQFVLTEDTRHDIVLDRFGVAEATEYYWGPFNQAVGFALGKSQHGSYPWLKRKSGQISRQEAEFAEIRITYAGVPPGTNQKTYRTTGNTSSEPIETHPKFASDIGGSSNATSKNGAKFDDDGKFIGFKDATNTKYGVKSYLSGNLNYEETWVTGNLASANALDDLGNISVPPSSSVKPSTAGGRTWLLISGSAEHIGATAEDAGGKITRVWRLSAKRGWDTDIYSP